MGERLPLGFLLNHLDHVFRQRTNEAFEPLDLRLYEFGLLVLADRGPIPQSHLGELMHADRTSMVGYIDKLEAKRLVERQRSEADRRVHLIVLTDLGRVTLQKARLVTEEVERDLTSTMTDRQREVVRELLARVVDDLHGHSADR